MRALSAARAWTVPPTVFLGHRADEGPWTNRDRELAEALVIYEAGLCPGCAQPLSESLDPDREGWYEVHIQTCAACRAKAAAKSGEEPGELVSVMLDPNYVKRT